MSVSKYLNRELGYLSFNERVLDLAEDPQCPPLEQLRFLCIADSNLDEFFEVRVAGLRELMSAKSGQLTYDGLNATEAFSLVSKRTHGLVARMYQILNQQVLPRLATEGIIFLRRQEWSESQRAWLKAYFIREILPVLTPLGLDPAHPFPKLINKSLNFAVELEGKDAFGRSSGRAVLQAPRSLARLIQLPKELAKNDHRFVFLSSILHENVDQIFPGMTIKEWCQFQVTRNSELDFEEEDVKNLRLALQRELPQRNYGNEVRLEAADTCSKEMANSLLQQFNLKQDDFYRINGPVNLMRLISVTDRVDRPDLKYPLFVQGLPKVLDSKANMFALIGKSDILLHHPFQSFKPVVDFIQQAANDAQVLAIKQTIYRAGSASELLEALIHAARRGKAVTVVVELLARFDEEANINWAARLEEAGAHVVYGVFGYKTHAKMSLVVRNEHGQLKRYAHLGTGNYHARTTKFYTDFGLLTCNPEICADVNDVFTQVTGLGKVSKLRHLWQSPFNLHTEVIKAVERETKNARAGKPAKITAKLNQLTEQRIINALYEASQAGVKIDLIVRGVCTLRPRVPGLSENIRVLSVMGRFLEHTRIFYFCNNRKYDLYISSADWMDRNFYRRIEIAIPILDPKIKRRIVLEGLRTYLNDNTYTWELGADGQYKRKKPLRRTAFNAQTHLVSLLAAK